MSADLAAEALAAVTGCWPRKPPSITTLTAAEKIPAAWSSRIRRWFTREEVPTFASIYDPPPEDQAVLRKRISEPLDVDEVAGWLVALGDPEIGAAYSSTIRTGRDYCAEQWPTVEIGTVAPEEIPLSPDEYEGMWSIVRVAEDPEHVIELMECYSLTPDDLAAFEAIFPELHAMFLRLVTMELVEHLAKKKSLTWQQEDEIRILRGLPPEAPIEIPAEAAAPVKPPREKSDFAIDFKATRTPAQDAVARD